MAEGIASSASRVQLPAAGPHRHPLPNLLPHTLHQRSPNRGPPQRPELASVWARDGSGVGRLVCRFNSPTAAGTPWCVSGGSSQANPRPQCGSAPGLLAATPQPQRLALKHLSQRKSPR